jgi:dihydrodipicolinate synthase/N-acetylneuraminate lyase
MSRETLVRTFLPAGIPQLWCPLVTHFREAGVPDKERIHRHLEALLPEVKGVLIPGSTGEGWDMSDTDILDLLDVVLDQSTETEQYLLVGVLKKDSEGMIGCIDKTVKWLCKRAKTENWQDAFIRNKVAGFTICPPTGAALSQEEIRADLEAVLSLAYPTALYQLPQVTGNEMSPETVEALAEKYQNFFLFKDTSGADKVALSGLDFRGVYLVRGAEGAYSRWPKSGSGIYDGFLLSTANCFSHELGKILSLLSAGEQKEADALSEAVEGAVSEMFALAGTFESGNAFANANKIFDHIRAYGPEASNRKAPLLYGGERLPQEWIERGLELLERNGLPLRDPYVLLPKL